MNCPVCNAPSVLIHHWSASQIQRNLKLVFPSPPLQTVDYTQWQCTKCTLVFFDPMQSADESFYNWLALQTGYYPASRKEWDIICQQLVSLPTNVELLEIGCGSGAFLERLTQLPNIIASGLDMSSAAVKTCKQKGLQVHCATMEYFLDCTEQKFDYVASFHCLEHVTDPLQFMQKTFRLLKPHGSVFVSTPHSPLSSECLEVCALNNPPHHLTQWNRCAYRALAKRLNANIEFYDADYTILMGRIVAAISRYQQRQYPSNNLGRLFLLSKHPLLTIRCLWHQFKGKGLIVSDTLLVKLTPKQ